MNCPLCDTRYAAPREDWATCLRCSGPPPGTRWMPAAWGRVREDAGEDELLEAASYLVDYGEADWVDEYPHQLELDR